MDPPAAELNNCEWMLYKARKYSKSNLFDGLSWLVTAKSLYPDHFAIQYEYYTAEKKFKKSKQAAELLLEMYKNFKDEADLLSELYNVTSSVLSSSQDSDSLLLQDIFEALPRMIQSELLLSHADLTKDILEHSKVKYLLFQSFPETIPQHSIKLIELLMDAEKQLTFKNPVNLYRKIFACNIFPIVVGNKDVKCSTKQLLKWFQKIVEFYICYINQNQLSPIMENKLINKGSGNGNLEIPTVKKTKDWDLDIENISPFENLFSLLRIIAKKCGWKTGIIPSPGISACQMWSTISDIAASVKDEETNSVRKPFFYSTLLLFLQTALEFSKINTRVNVGKVMNEAESVFIVEEVTEKLTYHSKTKHGHKRPRLSSTSSSDYSSENEEMDTSVNSLGMPNLSTNVNIESFQHLIIAADCWQLLHSNETLQKDFNWLLHRWKADKWIWFISFQTDMFVCKGECKKAIHFLEEQRKIHELPHFSEIKLYVQLSSCYFYEGNWLASGGMALECVKALPQKEFLPDERYQITGSSSVVINARQFCLLTQQTILPYCIRLILACLWNQLQKDDLLLGHMIVLLQYEWPKGAKIFHQITKKICQRNGFTYTSFFTYVINEDILEEFSYLKTLDNGKIKLSLLLPSESMLKQRTVTRGITKGGKEDFRLACEKQIAQANQNLELLMMKFLIEEKESLLKCLQPYK